MRLLVICGALAAGEYAASFASPFVPCWPLAAVAAVLVALFGYGVGFRGWNLISAFLLGVALFFCASTDLEQRYKEMPWLRGRERMTRRADGRDWHVVRNIRCDLSRRVGLGLEADSETANLSRAILLGERRLLSQEKRQTFIDSGTIHIFAISGLHVMAVAEVFSFLFCCLAVPRRLTGLFSVPLLWGYVRLIGFTPSAVRAATMASFLCLAQVFWRKPNGLRSWALTFLIVHVCNPLMIVNVGNVLSFVVMLALVLMSGERERDSFFRKTVVVTVVAWAVGVPITAHVFGRVTPGGILANLVLIATAKLTVVTGALGIVASYVSEGLAAHVNNLCALGIRSLEFVAEIVSRLPFASFDTGSWPLTVCALWYVGLATVAFCIARIERRWRRL